MEFFFRSGTYVALKVPDMIGQGVVARLAQIAEIGGGRGRVRPRRVWRRIGIFPTLTTKSEASEYYSLSNEGLGSKIKPARQSEKSVVLPLHLQPSWSAGPGSPEALQVEYTDNFSSFLSRGQHLTACFLCWILWRFDCLWRLASASLDASGTGAGGGGGDVEAIVSLIFQNLDIGPNMCGRKVYSRNITNIGPIFSVDSTANFAQQDRMRQQQ